MISAECAHCRVVERPQRSFKNSLSKEHRDSLLKMANLSVFIPCDHALAIKADLGMPWNTLRVIRRYIINSLLIRSLTHYLDGSRHFM